MFLPTPLHLITTTTTTTTELPEDKQDVSFVAWIVIIVVVAVTILISGFIICKTCSEKRSRPSGQNTSRRPGRNARSQRQQSLTYSNDPPSYDVVQGVAPPKYDTLPGMSNPVLDTRVSLTSASSGDIPPPSYEKAVEEPGEST